MVYELTVVRPTGAPGLGLAGGLAGEGLRGARDPLVGSARCDGDRAWLRDGDGGIERRYIAGVRVFRPLERPTAYQN